MENIKITWLGHSCFLIQIEEGGYRIALDPFEDGYVDGLENLNVEADAVLCSHDHHDHGADFVIRKTNRKLDHSFTITRLESFHDERNGELRGKNTMTIIEYGSIRIAHLGDIGCMPNEEQLEALKYLDAVLIPVGGFYTIEPEICISLLRKIESKIVIPMHYRSERFGFDTIKELSYIIQLNEFKELGYEVIYYDENSIQVDADSKKHMAVLSYRGGLA